MKPKKIMEKRLALRASEAPAVPKFPTKTLIKRSMEIAKSFRVTDGGSFRLKDVDPGDTLRFDVRGQAARQGSARDGHRCARRAPGHALCAGPLGGAAHLSGHGRRRQGRRDQARHVRRQPPGLPGLLLQGALQRGPRSRLSLALHEVAAGARPHRHLQSQLLRGGARRTGASRVSREAEAAARTDDQGHLEGALPGHSQTSSATSPATASSSASSSSTCRRSEQKKRFLERLENPEKNWKFSANDVKERALLERLHGRRTRT